VGAPRIHLERGRVSSEPGLAEEATAPLSTLWDDHHRWDAPNLFFGGCHTVVRHPDGFDGAGDPRRGGVFRLVH
jgi:gamma-glutamyltranspeptidase/glutathione hydrolase